MREVVGMRKACIACSSLLQLPVGELTDVMKNGHCVKRKWSVPML